MEGTDALNFDTMLARAKPGDEIVYHKGYHCLAATTYPKRNAEAQAAWAAYVRGDVLLYQRRVGPDALEYCARVLR